MSRIETKIDVRVDIMARITIEVKVMGSKVKVKLMILLKICLAYKSCTIGRRDTKMKSHVQYNVNS